ncbi:MAG: phosphotransferase, partial [Paracoccaceae bacterium]
MPDTPPPIGALLISAPPVLTNAQAAELALVHFGKSGSLTRLTSERDLNFRLTDALGRSFVLKLANPAEPAAVTQFQTMALLHLAATAADLPVPRVVHTLSGATEVVLPNGILRLLTYVEGTPLHSAQPTAAQRRSMARMGA